MLGNCEKMVVISSTTNEWPQTQIDEKGMNMGSTGNRVMEKPEQPLQQQQVLKCPRCDSSNTKFCYYNNYSLSQPRHFCKACKRYWTRGGTLRNVPVGGGCRKNKRVKRVSSNSVTTTTESSAHTNINPHHQTPQSHIEISSSNSTLINPLFYGLPSNNHHHPFHGFSSRGVSDVDAVSGFDLQPQLSALGLGFSSSTSSGILSSENGFNSNSLLSSYSMFGPSSSSSTTTPTMASLIASSFQQQKFMNGGLKEARGNHFQNLMPFEDMNIGLGNGENGISVKEVKMEEGGQNRMEWNVHNYNQNQIDQIGSHDQSSLYWNPSSTTLSAWPDLPNIGSSSVTSLI